MCRCVRVGRRRDGIDVGRSYLAPDLGHFGIPLRDWTRNSTTARTVFRSDKNEPATPAMDASAPESGNLGQPSSVGRQYLIRKDSLGDRDNLDPHRENDLPFS